MASSVHSNHASAASPPRSSVLDANVPIENTDQLRIAIDQGRSREKVDAPDPAAAPLGTDDEAGGSPDSAGQVRLAAAQEVRAWPGAERQRRFGLGSAWWLIGFSVFMSLGILVSLLWVRT